MSKKALKRTGQGSPKQSSHFNQPKAGLSTAGLPSTAVLLTRKEVNQPQAGLPRDGQPSTIAALLSRKEVAQRWHCCPHTIARRKDLQPVRFSRRFLRYRLTDVEAVEAAAN